ncbi:MAG: hypothetical protein FVQ77_08325 [Cytophagales bacterium]|nr:hypothetical protein [Cytophagales bacterium]
MKIKHIEIEINEAAPFSNCKLDREKYANTLTGIVKNYQDGFVLAINNKWGTGKTTFVKMWKQQLNSKGYKTLYFNAWENDFDANPLVAIMSELNLLTKKETKKAFKSLIEKGAVLTKNILPQLLKALAEKYIDTKVLVDLIENTAKGATEILDEEIRDYTQKKKGLKEFKISLEQFIKDSTDNKPIIFIIDELDRCRPNYAVELLEKIKHFFSVSGIVFVLSIDKTQLCHAVKGVYGNDRINADEYLRRFIDVEYSIPEPNTKEFCNYLFDYFEFNTFFYSENRKKISEFVNDKNSFIAIASPLFEKANITLRQQEKVFAHARIGLIFFKENQYLFPGLYLVLIFLKSFHKDFYDKIKLKIFTPQDLITEFSVLIPKGIDNDKIRAFIHLEALFVLMYNNFLPEDKSKRLIERDEQTGEEHSLVKSKFDTSENNNVFFKLLKFISGNPNFDMLSIEYLLRKIDLTEEIVIQ